MPADVDVAYFDSTDLGLERDVALRGELSSLVPTVKWDVVNQASVHLWYEEQFGVAVEPLSSLKQAVGTWPEYATAVGVCLTADDEIQVVAPHGLVDLFGMVVRHNPARASVQEYRSRAISKRYREHWALVRVEAE